MNYQDVLDKLLKNLLINKLEILENKYSIYTNILEECNLNLNAINEKNSEVDKKHIKYTNEDQKDNEIMRFSTLTDSSTKIKKFEHKEINRKKSFLITEKSVTALKAKFYKEERKVIRSNTKPNIKSKNYNSFKEIHQVKISNIEIYLEKEIKPIKDFYQPKPILKNNNLNKTVHQTINLTKFNSPLKTNKEPLKRKINKVLNTDENKKTNSKKNSKLVTYLHTEENFHTNSKNTPLITKTSDFFDNNINITKENNSNLNTDSSPQKPFILKVYDGNLDKKSEKLLLFDDINDILRNHFNSFSKFLNKNDLLNLRLNKVWNKLIMKCLISLKKDDLILNERNLKNLREKYSMDDLMKEPEQFSISISTKTALENIEKISPIEFETNNLTDNRILILYKAYFQAINQKIGSKSQEFLTDCSNYFKDKNIRELINEFSGSLDFSESNILKLSKIIYVEKILDLNISISTPFNELLIQLLKDICDYLGLFSDNHKNACILFSFYRYKFENLSQTIETLKKMENKYRKN